MSSTLTDKLVVAPHEYMNGETFSRHMNARHQDSLGGMDSLPLKLDPRVEGAYRAFHRRLHRLRIDLEHEHEAI